jgi:hypothetical protein
MFDLIDCSAFETSATVATLNDFFFPVVLFAVIFWVLCEIFLDVGVETQSFLIENQFASDGNSTHKDNTQKAGNDLILESLPANMAATIEEHSTKAKSFDVDTECQNLKALGARKLRNFCRDREIKGYASAYNRRGLDGLVDFLSAKQIYAHQIEQFKHVETLARGH